MPPKPTRPVQRHAHTSPFSPARERNPPTLPASAGVHLLESWPVSSATPVLPERNHGRPTNIRIRIRLRGSKTRRHEARIRVWAKERKPELIVVRAYLDGLQQVLRLKMKTRLTLLSTFLTTARI